MENTKPVLIKALCKGCGRCISACPRHAIHPGDEINQLSGLVPVEIDFEICNGCGLCIPACPEPYGLTSRGYDLEDSVTLLAAPGDMRAPDSVHMPDAVPERRIPLPPAEPLVIKGNYAAAIGAVLAGCRHVFGYPITPSTEGAELLARLQPRLGGVFLQAVSEVATVNLMYGCGAAGLPSVTFTSSPGFSLMLEGISYMVGAEVPAVFINVMRGGPGLGNIGPEQADIKLVCRGLGHGNTHAIVLAPATPQQMLDCTIEAFRLAFKYRNPVIVLADGYLGQMTGRVVLPDHAVSPGVPSWAVRGDRDHRQNLVSSIYLDPPDLEKHNWHLVAKFERMAAEERAELFCTDDAGILIVATNTPARIARGAVEQLRSQGIKAGLFHPLTLWPFPIRALRTLLHGVTDIVVVEASDGQLEDELRLALSHDGIRPPRIQLLRRMGGMLPDDADIVAFVRQRVVPLSREAHEEAPEEHRPLLRAGGRS